MTFNIQILFSVANNYPSKNSGLRNRFHAKDGESQNLTHTPYEYPCALLFFFSSQSMPSDTYIEPVFNEDYESGVIFLKKYNREKSFDFTC
jgi:hypothetical protein